MDNIIKLIKKPNQRLQVVKNGGFNRMHEGATTDWGFVQIASDLGYKIIIN